MNDFQITKLMDSPGTSLTICFKKKLGYSFQNPKKPLNFRCKITPCENKVLPLQALSVQEDTQNKHFSVSAALQVSILSRSDF